MNNERIQVSHVEASSRVQAPEILITGGNSIKVYDTANQKMGAISFQDADFIFYTDINGNIGKNIRSNPEAIEDGTIAHNSVVVHKNNVNETVSGIKTFVSNIFAPNLVYNTGDQTISGNKSFVNRIYLNNENDEAVGGTYLEGNISGITLRTFQQPTDITIKSEYVGGEIKDIFSIHNNYYTDAIFGTSINTATFGDQIVIYQTGSTYGVPYSSGPYLRLGENNIISEKSTSKLGIGTTFPIEKVHISGGNLKVEGNAIANNLVYNTGNQTISGNKTFIDNISVSGTGIFNAIDLNNIDNLSLSGVDVAINSSSNLSVTNSNVTFSGNNINFENQNNINLAYQFPAWTGIRRYAPLSLQSIATPSFPTTGVVVYFPFLIKKKIINPVACVEMTSHTSDPEIVMGIYSGHYGLQNAKLIASGSITGNSLNTGIYRTTLNGTFDQGPYIVASVLKSGRGAFRIAGNQSFREHFGIETGSSILHGINNTTSAHILYESGIYLNDTLPTNIGQELYWSISSANSAPVVFLEY